MLKNTEEVCKILKNGKIYSEKYEQLGGTVFLFYLHQIDYFMQNLVIVQESVK